MAKTEGKKKLSPEELREVRMNNIRPHQWQKGQSGNPKGPPKLKFRQFNEVLQDHGLEPVRQVDYDNVYKYLSSASHAILEEIAHDSDDPENPNVWPALHRHIAKGLLDDSLPIHKHYSDRAYGMATSKVQHGGNVGVTFFESPTINLMPPSEEGSESAA